MSNDWTKAATSGFGKQRITKQDGRPHFVELVHRLCEHGAKLQIGRDVGELAESALIKAAAEAIMSQHRCPTIELTNVDTS